MRFLHKNYVIVYFINLNGFKNKRETKISRFSNGRPHPIRMCSAGAVTEIFFGNFPSK